MLTEQDFEHILLNDLDGDNTYSVVVNTSKTLYNQHLAECERLMEIAFNAAREELPEVSIQWRIAGKNFHKYRTFQDFKDSLKTS